MGQGIMMRGRGRGRSLGPYLLLLGAHHDKWVVVELVELLVDLVRQVVLPVDEVTTGQHLHLRARACRVRRGAADGGLGWRGVCAACVCACVEEEEEVVVEVARACGRHLFDV